MINEINKYFEFISKQKVVSSAFVLIFANLLNQIFKKLIDDIIIPYSNCENKSINIKEYIGLIINFFIVTFILFVLVDQIERF